VGCLKNGGFEMSKFLDGLYFSPAADDGEGKVEEGDQSQNDQQQKQEKEALGWDTFHASLPEEAQKLIGDRESGLKTALKTERDSRKDVEKELKDVAGKLEKGSDAQKKVLKLADAVAAETEKSDFYEEAHEEGVSNMKLAYVVAKQDELISKRGKVDWKTLKESYPELFVKIIIPDGGAGDGTGGKTPSKKVDMNALIRKKAGRS